MKTFNKTALAALILLPLLLIGYQNCGALNAKDSSLESSLSSNNEQPKSRPVFVTDLGLLGYEESIDCLAESIPTLNLYSALENICTSASNHCEAFFLLQRGYSEDEVSLCEDTEDPQAPAFKSSLKAFNAQTVSGKTNPNQICTQQFAQMINFSTRECAVGGDGCQITALKERGFVVDRGSVCNN